MKTCFRCQQTKPLSDFYKHKQMKDGHLNKCIDCTKVDTLSREKLKRTDPVWHEQEKARAREKYYRLGYKDKHKPTAEQKAEAISAYKEKYPEKYKARGRSQGLAPEGCHAHHWSYQEEHHRDVIILSQEEHFFAHRFLVYDQEHLMYRGIDMVLLDSRDRHIEYINRMFKEKLPF